MTSCERACAKSTSENLLMKAKVNFVRAGAHKVHFERDADERQRLTSCGRARTKCTSREMLMKAKVDFVRAGVYKVHFEGGC